jgi:hypothetical protein
MGVAVQECRDEIENGVGWMANTLAELDGIGRRDRD